MTQIDIIVKKYFSNKCVVKKSLWLRNAEKGAQPDEFEYKITSPEVVIRSFSLKIQQFLQNCWRALNERPYKIPITFLRNL